MSATAKSNAGSGINSHTNNDAEPNPDININGTSEPQDNTNTTNIEPENTNPNNNNDPESNTSEIPLPSNIQPPTSPPATDHKSPQPQGPELDNKPLPLIYWLLTGGTGAPPSTSNFLRMTSERNAITREAEARVVARQQALAERRAYLARWDEEWGPVGARGLRARVFGSKKRKT
ncbi:hypothetical protein F5Y00DRAFT_271539 [Daldinia vernicosa]|uniref:uncharacterized protein n=1 Tax=Daldinia vernicosa TaxID=114800 RepID=UPI00200758E1|nr:uncharacterized protein F5Y00DRAFT_271539 [Daldinia vernicosa]KAI0846903.1 hypothetical protein F5Y00DRAFT_271539 [Daldinia vernicosa]